MNDQIYCKDLATGIVYRAVGLTYESEINVYPKYIPSSQGNRLETGEVVSYRAINFPVGSVRFLYSFPGWETENVKLGYSDKFGSFIPSAAKSKVEIYEGSKFLGSRLFQKHNQNNKLRKNANQLLELIIKNGHNLKIGDFGIDASILADLDKGTSDIDLLVYGLDKASEVLSAIKKLTLSGILKDPQHNKDYFVNRRKNYSPLMTRDEILSWESRKISGLYQGTKFSIMPKDPMFKDNESYLPTNQDAVIRFRLNHDLIVCDPGYIDFQENQPIEIIWGPKGVKIKKIITHLPSRMGVFLFRNDTIFCMGRLYKIRGSDSFALCQFPWDDVFTNYETKFVTKLETTKLDNMINSLLGFNFYRNGYGN